MNELRAPAVRFEDVTKAYDQRPTPAVDRLSLDIETGEVLSLLGPNGAGKTTTIEMLVGLRRPTSGRVSTLGVDPVRERDVVRRRVAVQPQHAAVFEQQTVEELLRFWASLYDGARTAGDVIAQMGLGDSRDVRVGRLSGGQKQRVLVGLALVSRPDLLVLDEPSTGLDPNARQELWAAIATFNADGGTVVLSTHSMEEAEQLSDRVAILHEGRLVACGTPASLVVEHAPQREISCTLATDLDAADTAMLHRLADAVVVTAGPRGGRSALRLTTSDSDAVLAVLSTGLGASNIQIHDAGLNGVFRTVTGRGFDHDVPRPELAGATTGDR